MVPSIRKVVAAGVSAATIIWIAVVVLRAAEAPAKKSYATPRNHEILIFNDVPEAIRFAVETLNPGHGTRSANYGIDARTTEHQVAGDSTIRYEVKPSERVKLRLLGAGQGRESTLDADHSYRLERDADGQVTLSEVPDVGVAVVTNRLGNDVHYEIMHGAGSDRLGLRSVIITLAPGGRKYHNVTGSVDIMLGLRHARQSAEPAVGNVDAGGRYEFRYDPNGRMTAPEGRWDLYPVEGDDPSDGDSEEKTPGDKKSGSPNSPSY